MRHFFDWIRAEGLAVDRPWLILGKGPSFALRDRFDLSRFELLSLNHVVREQAVRAAHAIDLDVVDSCGERILRNAGVLVMPWVPHVRNQPGTLDLARLAAAHPVLARLDAEDRLLWYDLESAPVRRGEAPPIRARFFSAEAALDLLAKAGVRRIRSLGIDGGAAYSPSFADLSETTRLNNGLRSYDAQFGEIAAILASTGADYAPLDVESPVRVYVGAAEEHALAAKVLEYSIRKHASMSVSVVPLHEAGVELPEPADPRNRARTPFSFQRFLIPELAGRRGRAIYLDSDMLVFKDIRALWTLPFDGAELLSVRGPGGLRDPQFSVMLLDCAALGWDIRRIVRSLDEGTLDYERLVYEMEVAPGARAGIDPSWNSMESFREGETALLHYTDTAGQPWLSSDNALGHLWFRSLFEAIDAGFISESFVLEEAAKGHVRPSIVPQLRGRLHDSVLLDSAARALDSGFVPPHGRDARLGKAPWLRPAAWLHAVMRHGYYGSPLPRLAHRARTKLRHTRLWPAS